MRCIILAGGRGTRLAPLTNRTPKSLLPIAGKPALSYTLKALPREITSLTIAVKYLGEQIKHKFGRKIGTVPISYVNLTSLRGTMDALKQCKKYVKGQTLVLYGDDIYSKEDLEELLSQAKKNTAAWHILVSKCEEAHRFGQVVIKDDRVIKIEEQDAKKRLPKNEEYVTNTGAYVVDERVFAYKPVKVSTGEYGLPQTLVDARKKIPLIAILGKKWLPLNTIGDYTRAQEILAKSFSRNSSRKESE